MATNITPIIHKNALTSNSSKQNRKSAAVSEPSEMVVCVRALDGDSMWKVKVKKPSLGEVATFDMQANTIDLKTMKTQNATLVIVSTCDLAFANHEL